MSASPKDSTVPSQKRPLEESSSPTALNDQPDAKRPALDKKEDLVAAPVGDDAVAAAEPKTTENGDVAAVNEELPATNGADHDAAPPAVADVPVPTEDVDTSAAQPPYVSEQPVQAVDGPATQAAQTQPVHPGDESQWLHLRSIISSAEAATIIGKGGENVSLIRRLSGAKCTVSDYSRGAVERVLTVSGLVDAVAKAFGLITRTLNNEPMEEPSTPQSKTYPLRLLIPHILIGSIIGKQGVRIREIQEASGARLNASDQCLALSTERSLVILGVADAVHIAAYYVGSTLVEQLTDRFNGPAASAYATRSGGAAGVVPGGMQVVPYVPQSVGGQWGPPDHFRRQGLPSGPGPAYGPPQTPMHGHMQGGYGGAGSPRATYGGGQTGGPYGGQPAHPQHAGGPPQQAGGMPGQPLTQQIYIPNDMVGAIIGKGGAKINEIRQLSGSVIKINEPQDNSNERLVTITGTQECNQMALYMLYQRLGQVQAGQK